MISIILTTYVEDHARLVHLQYSFKQLLQTNGDYEIIIIDNSANEGFMTRGYSASYSFFRQHKGGRIRYFEMEKNTGMGGAKNIGVQHAEGSHFMFVDNDFFYLTPEWLNITIRHYVPGSFLSPIQSKEKYWLRNYNHLRLVEKFSPGCFFVDRKTYGDYHWDEEYHIPGRKFFAHFRKTRKYILKEPLVLHEGRDYHANKVQRPDNG